MEVHNTSKIRTEIYLQLNRPKRLEQTSEAIFSKFNQKQPGQLDYSEFLQCAAHIFERLRIEDFSEQHAAKFFLKYANPDSKRLGRSEFQNLYRELLLRIQHRFYPPLKRSPLAFLVPHRIVGDSEVFAATSGSARYQILDTIGAGTSGTVYRVLDKRTNEVRACKQLLKKYDDCPMERAQVTKEVEVLKQLTHPNVIRTFEFAEDSRSWYIVQELGEGGILHTTDELVYGRTKANFTEEYLKRFMHGVLRGLAYIHEKHVIHKDLKLENIVLADKTPNAPPKIIDFGLCGIYRRGHSLGGRGTPVYDAPEVIDGNPQPASDVWSAGVILYLLLANKPPFWGEDRPALDYHIKHEPLNIDRDCKHLSEQGRSLLSMMFEKNPVLRIEAKTAVTHPWFTMCSDLETPAPAQFTDSIIQNLETFAGRRTAHDLFHVLLAHRLPFTNHQVQKITRLFETLDSRNTGHISVADLLPNLTQAGFEEATANKIAQKLDYKGSDRIAYREFLAACYTWNQLEDDQLWIIYNQLPLDKCQEARVEDVQEFVNGLTTDSRRAERILQRMTNPENKVTWMTFHRALKQEVLQYGKDQKKHTSWGDSSFTIA